ncbi:hypothetical protein JR316_0012670 [Psilocybe cubensis]|uniref:Uncharacterized protein n=2 Tax=Psilocybe cubensis TaxID=181762 RepID=A0ACB8GIL4_PSICU|nr:hypothetical protein JR316_0012670 [Psilocybe cubensis]KAH9475555.1 hypothetical protein JR316_0012670 [Psilocybe cubensis]
MDLPSWSENVIPLTDSSVSPSHNIGNSFQQLSLYDLANTTANTDLNFLDSTSSPSLCEEEEEERIGLSLDDQWYFSPQVDTVFQDAAALLGLDCPSTPESSSDQSCDATFNVDTFSATQDFPPVHIPTGQLELSSQVGRARQGKEKKHATNKKAFDAFPESYSYAQEPAHLNGSTPVQVSMDIQPRHLQFPPSLQYSTNMSGWESSSRSTGRSEYTINTSSGPQNFPLASTSTFTDIPFAHVPRDIEHVATPWRSTFPHDPTHQTNSAEQSGDGTFNVDTFSATQNFPPVHISTGQLELSSQVGRARQGKEKKHATMAHPYLMGENVPKSNKRAADRKPKANKKALDAFPEYHSYAQEPAHLNGSTPVQVSMDVQPRHLQFPPSLQYSTDMSGWESSSRSTGRSGYTINTSSGPQNFPLASTSTPTNIPFAHVPRDIERVAMPSRSTFQDGPIHQANSERYRVPINPLGPFPDDIDWPSQWNAGMSGNIPREADMTPVASSSALTIPYRLEHQSQPAASQQWPAQVGINNGFEGSMMSNNAMISNDPPTSTVDDTARPKKRRGKKQQQQQHQLFSGTHDAILFCTCVESGVKCNEPLISQAHLGNHVANYHDVKRGRSGNEVKECPWEGCDKHLKVNSLWRHIIRAHGKMLPKE